MDETKDIVISLFDYTGAASLPYTLAGYTVIKVDLKSGIDILTWNYRFIPKNRVAAVLAAPPCTDYTRSGAQYFRVKDKDGRTAMSNRLISKTLEIIDYFKPAIWWMENPIGRLRRMLAGEYEKGEPKITIPASLKSIIKKPRLVFNPNDYGDPWAKGTCLWGQFTDPQKRVVEPVQWSEQGSWSQLLGGKGCRTKEIRSITPAGFARHFFEANNPLGAKLQEHLYFFGRCKIGMWTCDFSVSRTMCDICEDGDNYEPNEYAMEFDEEMDFLLAVFDKGEGIRRSVSPELIYKQ